MSLRYAALEDLSERYDAFLVDQFGVLLSGKGAYPGAAEALSFLGRCGKPTIVLSNSGKRSEPNCARLVQNGFARENFLTVLTSGEVAREYILSELDRSIPFGGRVIVLIRQGDTAPLDGVDLEQTEDAATADLLLIVSRDTARQVSSYNSTLSHLAARGAPCLCVNPDMKMLTPEGLISSAGRLAQIYEELGGPVRWFGKPHPLIYEWARALLVGIPPERILCIGDSLSHDIKGGQGAGHATALVRTGVHADLSDAQLADEIAASGVRPDFYLRAFRL